MLPTNNSARASGDDDVGKPSTKMSDESLQYPVAVIGGGPAGLGAMFELGRLGIPAVCFEATGEVGGLSRTVVHNGFRFDLGGHRFFTKNREVDQLWHDVLGNEFMKRKRLSRIYYRGRFFAYPVRAWDAFQGLGAVESFLIFLSYLWRQAFPYSDVSNFENWNANLFGDRLYRHFFKTYTEKVWGIPCSRIASSWGSQRIKGLSLFSTLKSAVLKPRHGEIKTLIEEFEYPRLGPGQMYNAMAQRSQSMGGRLLLNHEVIGLKREGDRIVSIRARTEEGEREFPVSHVISSMPFTDLARAIQSALSSAALEAAGGLTYRSLLTVNLLLKTARTIPDTWIYIHDPSVKMGRIQCFKNWSQDMVPDDDMSSLGCEYFATEGDETWLTPDAELVDLARRELAKLGIPGSDAVQEGFVVRVPKAYPVIDLDCESRVATVRRELASIANLQLVGRYGMFRYNNMDHSILTGMLAARNIVKPLYDIWRVNADEEYLEHSRVPDEGRGSEK